MFTDELILAFRLVDRNFAARHDAQSVGGLELQIPQRGLEHEAAQLRGGVLQREVQVSGVPEPAVRELAFHPDLEEIALEEIANANRELSDGQNPTGSRESVVGSR